MPLPQLDSLIFDMDGTLWNATQSYADVWNEGMRRYGLSGQLRAADITGFIGMTIGQIFDTGLLGKASDLPVSREQFLHTLDEIEDEIMPTRGGILYPGVKQGLEALSSRYRLFLVSNCSPDGLTNFMRFTGTTALFTDSVSHGQRPVPKSDNIRHMVTRHQLRSAAYVGDTQHDADQAHQAGLPFIFASYGFGTCTDAELTISSFDELVQQLMP